MSMDIGQKNVDVVEYSIINVSGAKTPSTAKTVLVWSTGLKMQTRKVCWSPVNSDQASTALTLRLVKPYFGTNRTIIADSAFSSVITAHALLSHGLRFMGVVKTAHSKYPKDSLNLWGKKAERGSHEVFTTNLDV